LDVPSCPLHTLSCRGSVSHTFSFRVRAGPCQSRFASSPGNRDSKALSVSVAARRMSLGPLSLSALPCAAQAASCTNSARSAVMAPPCPALAQSTPSMLYKQVQVLGEACSVVCCLGGGEMYSGRVLCDGSHGTVGSDRLDMGCHLSG